MWYCEVDDRKIYWRENKSIDLFADALSSLLGFAVVLLHVDGEVDRRSEHTSDKDSSHHPQFLNFKKIIKDIFSNFLFRNIK